MKKKRLLVVTADGGSARFFEGTRPGTSLHELSALTLHASPPVLSHGKPGRVHDRMGPARHAVEARQSPRVAAETRFLKQVGDAINAQVEGFDLLVLCAPPRPLGVLREHLSDVSRARLSAEYAKDYLHETPEHLFMRLEEAES